MSNEIVAQPGLTKVECDVVITALAFFEEALNAKTVGEGPQHVAIVIKKHQYGVAAESVKSKIVRSTVHLGTLDSNIRRNLTPGSGKLTRM